MPRLRWLHYEVAVYRASVENSMVLYAQVTTGAGDTFGYNRRCASVRNAESGHDVFWLELSPVH
jgi:hypothetical protein